MQTVTLENLLFEMSGVPLNPKLLSDTLLREGKAAEADMELLNRFAISVNRNSKSPYSNFKVSAAFLAGAVEDQGPYAGQYVFRVFKGVNVENAAYPSGLCAERTTINNLEAQYPGYPDIYGLSIYTPTKEPVTPCGACRQVLAEFLPPNTPIYSYCDGPEVARKSMAYYLPDAFTREALGMGKVENSTRGVLTPQIQLAQPWPGFQLTPTR